jgi:hypothetical protein
MNAPAVLCQHFDEAEQRLCERLHAQLGAALRLLLDRAAQVCRGSDLKRAGSQHHCLVINHVLDSTQAVTHSILDLQEDKGAQIEHTLGL